MTMKKLFVLFCGFLCLLATSVFAQETSMKNTGVAYMVSDQNGAPTDTTADATTDTQSIALGGSCKKVTFHIIGKELSGTANIRFTVEVSNDGINYTTHPAADTVYFVNTASGVFQSQPIEIEDYAYTNVRIKGVGSGTQSTLWSVKMKWVRKFED
jgi:hypothetical protein